MTTEDSVITNHKALILALQDVLRAYYEDDIHQALDNLDMAKNRFDALRYHLFQSTHRSGEKG